jgi:hypothetical protein
MGLFLMVIVEFGDSVQYSGDLLGLACEEEVAGEHSNKLLKVVFPTLFKHDLSVGREQLSRTGVIRCH